MLLKMLCANIVMVTDNWIVSLLLGRLFPIFCKAAVGIFVHKFEWFLYGIFLGGYEHSRSCWHIIASYFLRELYGFTPLQASELFLFCNHCAFYIMHNLPLTFSSRWLVVIWFILTSSHFFPPLSTHGEYHFVRGGFQVSVEWELRSFFAAHGTPWTS